jgi:predicted transcriptional regulator of viral defense system
VCDLVLAIQASDHTPPADAAIAALTKGQHGVVARDQLRTLGLGKAAIEHRVRAGRLHRLHPGVYAVGHVLLSSFGRFVAAVFACGPGAVLSHWSAAHLHRLLASARTRVDVLSPRDRRPKRGIAHHRTRSLPPGDVTVIEGIPVTTVARTLLDLAGVARPRQLERALDQAEVLGTFDLAAIEAILARANGHRGAARLRAALALQQRSSTLTRSGLEEAFLTLVDAAALPRPRLNVRLCGFTVDAYWPESGLVAEIDSFRYHRRRRSFEADRRRDIALQTAGLRVVRVTDTRIEFEPEGVVEDLVRLAVDSATTRSS